MRGGNNRSGRQERKLCIHKALTGLQIPFQKRKTGRAGLRRRTAMLFAQRIAVLLPLIIAIHGVYLVPVSLYTCICGRPLLSDKAYRSALYAFATL
jgi:hypothetical protein